jgi:uncharacterized phage protein gp47/JayE
MVRDNVTAMLLGAAMVPNNVLRVMCDVMAGLARLVLEYIDWLAKQLLPDSAEREWLDRHGQIWLVNSDGTVGRKMPTLASGALLCTGQPGFVIPIGSRFGALTADATAFQYETLNQIALDQNGNATVNVRAIEPGSGGNIPAGSTINFSTAVTGVNGTATVVSLQGGTEEESDDELRARVLLRIRNPPMGGDQTDYVQWALAVPGVSRAWCFPNEMGIGTVTVRFMMDELRVANNGFPIDQDVAAVQGYLDTVRPVAVKDFWAEAPIPYPINLVIANLDSDDTGTEGNILVSLQTMFNQRAMPGQTWFRAWTDTAITTAGGVNSYDIISPVGEVFMPSPGYMPTIGTIQYQ